MNGEGPNWTISHQNEPKQTKMNGEGSQWTMCTKIDHNGPKQPKMNHEGQKRLK